MISSMPFRQPTQLIDIERYRPHCTRLTAQNFAVINVSLPVNQTFGVCNLPFQVVMVASAMMMVAFSAKGVPRLSHLVTNYYKIVLCQSSIS